MEKGVSPKIYNVNQKRKAYAKTKWEQNKYYAKSSIGDGNDSYVRNMLEDEIDPRAFSAAMQAALSDPSTPTAEEALRNFVEYGITNHRARNYMLFLLGHGMIVGRDKFLPADDPISAITLTQLQRIVEKFRENGKTGLQLLALHSCSMSNVEVAYQLRGTANYMIAHQGPAFVNSWPYRQLLKKIFNTIEQAKSRARRRARPNNKDVGEGEETVKNVPVDVDKLVEELYYLCLHNATDFMSAGYSGDLTLCSLQEDKLSRIKVPLQNLVQKLKVNLHRPSLVQDLIVLAHWKSQSFYQENYTDLYDFCRCLSKGCKDTVLTLRTYLLSENRLVSDLRDVSAACDELMSVLKVIKSNKRSERFEGLVIHEDNFGWKHQYARGLSVYFPWSEPLNYDRVPSERMDAQPAQLGTRTPEMGTRTPETGISCDCPPIKNYPADLHRTIKKFSSQSVTDRYRRYDFTTDFGEDSWWSFLESYFESTKRLSPTEEEGEEKFAELLDVNLTHGDGDSQGVSACISVDSPIPVEPRYQLLLQASENERLS
jgi:hypothetical protein